MSINNNDNFFPKPERKTKFNPNQVAGELRYLISKRKKATVNLDKLWNQQLEGNDRTNEIDAVSRQIGSISHKINILLSQLVNGGQYSNNSYNIANNFIVGEIRRLQAIINFWLQKIEFAESGDIAFVIKGKTHEQTVKYAQEYIEQKERQISRYQKMLHRLRLN